LLVVLVVEDILTLLDMGGEVVLVDIELAPLFQLHLDHTQ
jgi:hypothetical protein